MPDLLLRDAVPEDLPWLLRLLPRADVYLQDEVEIALHPTLTRVWSPKGRRRQRLVEAPGNNEKQYGFGLVDWRDGWLDWERAPGRRAAPFCAQLRRAVARCQARGRIAMVLLDNLGIHHLATGHPAPDRQTLRGHRRSDSGGSTRTCCLNNREAFRVGRGNTCY